MPLARQEAKEEAMDTLVELSTAMAGMAVALVTSRAVLAGILTVTFRRRP